MAVHLDPLPFTLSQKTVQFRFLPFEPSTSTPLDRSLWTWLIENPVVDVDTTFLKPWHGHGHDFRNRGVYMDVDTEIFENCGVDMDTAWNRCPPNSDSQYNIESNLENELVIEMKWYPGWNEI